MKNLQEMKVAELKVVAKEIGIALSFTENGKRHALNKGELIEAIETKQTVEVKQVEVKVTNSNVYGKQGEATSTHVELKTAVKVARKQVSEGEVSKVKETIEKLNKLIIAEKRNKLLVKKMSDIRNILSAMIKMKKGGKVHV